MEFLKPLFYNELDDAGLIDIWGEKFVPSEVLQTRVLGHDLAFKDWKLTRAQNLLEFADEILSLYDNSQRFERLKLNYKNEDVIPFIGAGMSMPSGYPSWEAFLRTRRRQSSVAEWRLLKCFDDGDFEEAAQLIFDDDPAVFNEGLTIVFAQEKPLKGPVQYLPYLFPQHALTTNFDNVLRRAYEQADMNFEVEGYGDETIEIARLLSDESRALIMLHGHCEQVVHRVVTRVEYEGVYNNAKAVEKLMNDIIFKKTLLFLGCSLSHDRLQKAMQTHVSAATAANRELVKHYAFVELPETEAQRVRRIRELAACNIFPIWYHRGRHDEAIEALLLKLAAGIKEL